MTNSEQFIEANRANWNDRSRLHGESLYYDLPGFLAGASSLYPLEQAEVGAVAGERLPGDPLPLLFSLRASKHESR